MEEIRDITWYKQLIKDLEKLIDIRNKTRHTSNPKLPKIYGYRQKIVFLARTCFGYILQNDSKAIRTTHGVINLKFLRPIEISEIAITTISYKKQYQIDIPTWISETHLDLTENEMRYMKVLKK